MARNSLFMLFVLLWAGVAAQPYDTSMASKEPAGAWYRADTSKKEIYLVFTAHDLYEGLPFVRRTLKEMKVKASFFLTGDFIRNQPIWVTELRDDGHYVGPHSDKHLLYCDWTKRDSLLVPLPLIQKDI
jgi:peptidoglycan/xylan/chitin deacetylase (PgdA/CDA1 family)